MQHSTTLELRDMQHPGTLELDDMQHEKSTWSPLALASFSMGVLSLVVILMRSVNVYFLGAQLILAIAAIVTGTFGMKKTRELGQRGYCLAYAGMVCGSNGVLWNIIHEVVTYFLTPDAGASGGRLGG